jgi:hypothetical protein
MLGSHALFILGIIFLSAWKQRPMPSGSALLSVILMQFPGLAGPWIARRCDDRQAGFGERLGRSASGR